ncbi:hypothetical protein, partial [Nocardia sp. NPDC004750]
MSEGAQQQFGGVGILQQSRDLPLEGDPFTARGLRGILAWDRASLPLAGRRPAAAWKRILLLPGRCSWRREPRNSVCYLRECKVAIVKFAIGEAELRQVG